MKFIKFIAFSILSLVATTAFARMDTDARVTQLERQMRDVRVENANGTYGATTATARAEVDGYGWSIMLGPIYQHARVGGTEYTYTDDDQTASLPIHGRVKDIDFNWDWGIRLGLGYNFEHDAWDLQAEYTWFASSGERSVTAGFNSSNIPLRGSALLINGCDPFFADFGFCDIAKSQFEFDYNTIVLELGRNYFLSANLSVRPHFGVRSTWLDLQQVVRYSGGSEAAVEETELSGLGVNTVDIKDDSDFWGLGPRAGIDTKWHFGSGFSIFGDASGSLLYGRFDVDHREKFSLCPNTHRIKIDANHNRFVPVAQLQLGIAYDFYYDDNAHHFGIKFGYDAIYYWRANQMLKIDDYRVSKYERYTEDVAIHGLMLEGKWTF